MRFGALGANLKLEHGLVVPGTYSAICKSKTIIDILKT